MRAIRRGTVKKAYLLFIAMMFLSTHAMGAEEPPQWLYDAIKKDNPNQLAYFVGIDRGCPFTKETLNQIVEGVFIRNRIKPLKEDVFVSGRIYLHLYVRCVQLKNNNPVFSARAYFGRLMPTPAVVFDYDFGNLGIGPTDYIQQKFKRYVEDAITAYVKANFNL